MATPDLDFETYSEAGYIWNPSRTKWEPPKGATRGGLPAVGAAVYAKHPSTEILSLAYNLKDGLGPRVWLPGMSPPSDLFGHIMSGGVLEAANCEFEWWIWHEVGHKRLGWPALPYHQLRDVLAKTRAHCLPGKLKKVADVLQVTAKIAEGKRLIRKFSIPRQPTKNNSARRTYMRDEPADAKLFVEYNLGDIKTESEISDVTPDLMQDELEFWQLTTGMNLRGVQVDHKAVENCIAVLEQVYQRYDAELETLTGGTVKKTSEIQKLAGWLGGRGHIMSSLDADRIAEALKQPLLPPDVRRALELRQSAGSAGVKKLYALSRRTDETGRAYGLFIYHGARTGRDTGADIQPQNLVKRGPKLRWCEDAYCGKPYARQLDVCPHCGTSEAFSRTSGWSADAVDHALEVLATRDLDRVEQVFGDAVLTMSGCVRGLFTAGPGKELICSDFSSIEAVVIAMLAGEQWRIEAFRRKDPIYLLSASRITGTSVDEYINHKEQTGEHHPDRQYVGKVAELGLGFGGWINAWLQFDDSGRFSEDEIKRNIIAWREASPAIVELWGGQVRGKPWAPDRVELFGLEGAAIAAVQNPGTCYQYRMISYGVSDDVLYCRLPSGRLLAYHKPRLTPSPRWENQLALTFEGWNSNPTMGPVGWIRISTYGGRLAENCIAENTKVLTNRGWVRIQDIKSTDLVHDGVEFANHSGLLYKGVQTITEIDGVYMTPDHEVLTNEGWQTASQKPRPYRPKIWNVNCDKTGEIRRQKTPLGLFLQMRQTMRKSRYGSVENGKKRPVSELRVHDAGIIGTRSAYPWNEQPSRILGLALNERSLPPTNPPSLAQLRGSWDKCLLRMAGFIRKFLVRHGSDLSRRVGTGPTGQQPGVQPPELSMGLPNSQREQPANLGLYRYPKRTDDGSRSKPVFRDRANHNIISDTEQLARRKLTRPPGLHKSKVYDIVNCGPRTRFVVLGNEGPFIVHNCTQAVARDIMRDANIRLERAGYPTVLRVHDELVAEVPLGFGSIEQFEQIMSEPPSWAPDWPIRAAGGWRGRRYRKD